MESVADWVQMYKRSVRLSRRGEQGEPPVMGPGGVRLWNSGTMRDDCELGPRVGWTINAESFGSEVGRLDAILTRGFKAYPPASFLDLLPA